MMSRVPVRLLLVVLLALVAAPIPMMQGLAQETAQPGAASPTDGWETAPPASRGMDPALLAEADRRVRTELPLLSAMLVARGDALVFEQYYNGQSADDPIHVWSMTKSASICSGSPTEQNCVPGSRKHPKFRGSSGVPDHLGNWRRRSSRRSNQEGGKTAPSRGAFSSSRSRSRYLSSNCFSTVSKSSSVSGIPEPALRSSR